VSIKGLRVAFLGAGNMGEALIKGLTQTGLVPAGSITAADPRADHLGQVAKRYGIRAVTDNSALVSGADVIILAVKPQIMAAVLKEVASAVDEGKGFFQQPSGRAMDAEDNLFGLRKDGSEVQIEIGLNPIRTDEGAFVLADIVDITRRKQTEGALRASEERARRGEKIWEQTFDAIDEGILLHDAEKRIVRCNARAAAMMNRKPAEVIGLSFKEVFTLLFGERAADYYLAESRGPSAAFEVQTEGGQRFLMSVFPIQKPDGEPLSVVTWNDVTRTSEMQEQLARTRRLASVGQLAAGVAHEINNPLAAITTCAEATMRDIRQTTAAHQLAEDHQWNYYLEEIVRQALRCKEITRGLLDLTRQRKAGRVMCDINSLAKQCAKVAVQRVGSVAEFEVNLDDNVGEVATDEAMVRQILDNLLGNAIDALGDGRGKISVSTIRDGDRIAIEVADTGRGISSELMSRIFDPFFSTKGPGKGYGLGLAISLSLAESLGGALTVESKEKAGSRFRLWIPRRRPEQ
jgi:PAS domain S-box-containing protein